MAKAIPTVKKTISTLVESRSEIPKWVLVSLTEGKMWNKAVFHTGCLKASLCACLLEKEENINFRNNNFSLEKISTKKCVKRLKIAFSVFVDILVELKITVPVN